MLLPTKLLNNIINITFTLILIKKTFDVTFCNIVVFWKNLVLNPQSTIFWNKSGNQISEK